MKATETTVGSKFLHFTWNGEDITEDVTYENGKANPFGWSQYEITFADERIGWLESGYPIDMKEGFAYM